MPQNTRQEYDHGPEAVPDINYPILACNTCEGIPRPPQQFIFESKPGQETPLAQESPNPGKVKRGGRRKLLAIGVIGAVVGLGAGVGIGYAIEQPKGLRNMTTETQSPCPLASSSATPTSTGITSGTKGVTSGITGIASFDCNNSDLTYFSPIGHKTYAKECNVDYDGNDIEIYIAYNFDNCIDVCDLYNKNQRRAGQKQDCMAVTYVSNLTSAVQYNSGNCFLKSGRTSVPVGAGSPNAKPHNNYTLIGSAYRSGD